MSKQENEENEEPKQNILGIVSLGLGIIAIVTGFCFISTFGPNWLLLMGIPTLVIGIIAVLQIRAKEEVGMAIAIAGMVLGGAAILLWILGPIIGELFRTV